MKVNLVIAFGQSLALAKPNNNRKGVCSRVSERRREVRVPDDCALILSYWNLKLYVTIL